MTEYRSGECRPPTARIQKVLDIGQNKRVALCVFAGHLTKAYFEPDPIFISSASMTLVFSGWKGWEGIDAEFPRARFSIPSPALPRMFIVTVTPTASEEQLQ